MLQKGEHINIAVAEISIISNTIASADNNFDK